MENNFAKKLRPVLIFAVVLNLVIIVMQGFSSVKTIENSKKSLMLVGRTALSSFEGGRRAHLLLDPDSGVRFRSFIDSIGADTGVLSLYLFDDNGVLLFNTKDVPAPAFSPKDDHRGAIETPGGLFMYHTLNPMRPMMGNMMRQNQSRFMNEDKRQLTAGVMLDLSGHKALIRDEFAFLSGMLALEILLIAVYFYTAKLLKVHTEQSRRLEASEREAELGKMSRVMAHELKNPLSSVKGLMEFAAKKSEGDIKDISERCVDELSRLDRIINDYLAYGKDITLNVTEADIKPLAEDTAKLLELDAEAKDIFIDIQGGALIKADSEKMRQVLFNLLLNAVQGAPAGSEISVDISAKGLRVTNDIADKSFNPADLGKPFYTTKTVGTGLGLAIVKRIVQLHGFNININTDDIFSVEIKFS